MNKYAYKKTQVIYNNFNIQITSKILKSKIIRYITQQVGNELSG